MCLHVWCPGQTVQAGHDGAASGQVNELIHGSCYRKSSLHAWCASMARQAAHEDDAATDKQFSIGNVIKSRLYMFGAPAWPGRPHMKMMMPLDR
jgi:hypothetical protein